MVAEVPLASESSDSHIQSITMSQDGVSLVTLLSSDDGNLSQGQVMSEGQLINIANIVQGNANIVQGNGDASDMYENSMDNLENATSLSGVVIQENGVQYIVTSIDKENESHNESDHESDNVRTENE
ncbi:hypothetical protein DPMN_026872 [Dreissena polymorpha]|uniref:Uncharacterized protein n=2 Tax=Dreissena polymorpha TaxID=45954 RepID=A0A9D4LU87_DREPO|nr:hypothetical protein DPMN_026872 [Dreissena polymorpha]